jgi:hypothetical protein
MFLLQCSSDDVLLFTEYANQFDDKDWLGRLGKCDRGIACD